MEIAVSYREEQKLGQLLWLGENLWWAFADTREELLSSDGPKAIILSVDWLNLDIRSLQVVLLAFKPGLDDNLRVRMFFFDDLIAEPMTMAEVDRTRRLLS